MDPIKLQTDEIGTSLRTLKDIDSLRYCTIALTQPLYREGKEIWYREFLNCNVQVVNNGQLLLIKEYYFNKHGHEDFVLDKLLVYPMSEIQNITVKTSTFVDNYMMEQSSEEE